LRLHDEKLIKITHLCRENIDKGDCGLGVPVVKEFPTDVDFMVVCGHPSLHKKGIDFSNDTKIPVFVEKPHIVTDQFVNDRVMIPLTASIVEHGEFIEAGQTYFTMTKKNTTIHFTVFWFIQFQS